MAAFDRDVGDVGFKNTCALSYLRGSLFNSLVFAAYRSVFWILWFGYGRDPSAWDMTDVRNYWPPTP
jgi:hypothetical protein